jgi:hypothetical protein
MQLSQRDVAPRNLFLVLGGIGPAPEWSPELEVNPLRGVRNIRFRLAGRGSAARVDAWAWRVPLHLTPGAAPWYARHQARDNVIHELIADSRYSVDSAFELGAYAGKTTTGVVVGVVIATASIAAGALITYLGAKGNSGEAVFYGIAIAIGGTAYGINKALEFEQEARAQLTSKSDPSPYYRFVRFLPDYAWIGWSDEPAGRAVWAQTEAKPLPDSTDLVPALGTVAPNVYIGYLPDVAAP